MRWLYRYRYLSATQLVALLAPRSKKRFIERLGDLYHETGLIDRPKAQWRHVDARYRPIIYELSQKGVRYLEETEQLPLRAVTFGKGGASAAPHFEHAMMIVDALVQVEIETMTRPGKRFVPADEIIARMPEKQAAKHPLAVSVTIGPNKHLPAIKTPLTTHLIPDALYGIEHEIDGERKYRFYALECERTSPKYRRAAKYSSLALKKAAYEALIASKKYKEAWNVPNVELQIITSE